MSLSNCYIESMRLDINPFSRNITTYYDNIWEIRLDNILSDKSSTSMVSSLSLEPLEILFENRSTKNESIDCSDDTDTVNDLYDKRFYSKLYDTTKLSPNISLTAIHSHLAAIKKKDSVEMSIKRKSKGKRNNKDRKKKSILQKSQVSLFFQRQKKIRSMKQNIDETNNTVGFGFFAGDVDKRHEACAIDGINYSTSMKSHKDCVCRSFAICRSPLRQEIR
ncbi:Spr6p PWA37_001739 [Arxiozyma heterogenica]|uniref:Spr6p n=1 Tax=Arxiozyma heterogenica TaxID=278026 RepID=UPI002F0C3D04